MEVNTQTHTRTVEPAWVMLLGADGGPFPKAPEDGEVSSH